eukprot:1939348-Amphidinium_carterae.1
MDKVSAIPCVAALTAPTSSDSHDDKLVSACFPLFQWIKLRAFGSLPMKIATPLWVSPPPGASQASDVMKRTFFLEVSDLHSCFHFYIFWGLAILCSSSDPCHCPCNVGPCSQRDPQQCTHDGCNGRFFPFLFVFLHLSCALPLCLFLRFSTTKGLGLPWRLS